MNKIVFGLLFMLVLGTFAEVKEEEDVLVLTDDNFDEVIQQHEFLLIEFYAPWCGHCKKLAPEYAKAAGQLKKSGSVARLAKVDSTVEKKIAERFEVKGYPTIKFFTSGNPIEFGGGRTAQEIVDWVSKKLLPPSQELKTIDQAEKLISDNEVVVIFFGESGTEEHSNFVTVARGFDDVNFAHTSESSIANKHQVEDTSSPKVVLFKKFDEGRNDYTGNLKVDELKAFVDQHQYPTILPFTQKAAQRIFGDGIPALFLFHEGEDAGNKALEALKEASAALKGKIILSVSGVKEGLPKRLADYVGVSEKDVPTIRIVDPGHDELQKFTLESDISADTIIQFYEDWANKRLQPVYKSEEIPASNDQPVKILVGKNFKDIALDSNKDVLVEFYAPWCGHCKALSPIYDKLAAKLLHMPNLVIAKMDSTANEVEGVKVQGFPTIKFYPANRKSNPIDFNGDRTEEGFIKFLKEHMTVPFIDAPEGEKSEL